MKRPLWTALAVSLAVHASFAALALHGARLPSTVEPSSARDGGGVDVEIVARAPARAGSQAAHSILRQPGLPKRNPEARPRLAPVAKSFAESAVAERVSGPDEEGEGRKTGTDAGPEGGSAPSGLAGASSGGVTPDFRMEIEGRLADAARRCYPERARRFRLKGWGLLSFCLSSGAARDAALKASSGAALLDQAILGCVLPGAQPFPDAASGCYEVRVSFEEAPPTGAEAAR